MSEQDYFDIIKLPKKELNNIISQEFFNGVNRNFADDFSDTWRIIRLISSGYTREAKVFSIYLEQLIEKRSDIGLILTLAAVKPVHIARAAVLLKRDPLSFMNIKDVILSPNIIVDDIWRNIRLKSIEIESEMLGDD